MDKLSDVQKLQGEAHIAEYQALMTRMSWFMSLQFMPVVPTIAFFSFVALTQKDLSPLVVAWGAAWVVQVSVLIYYFALHEVYNHALYIEINLKERFSPILQLDTASFWGWERHLKKFGKANDPRFGDLIPASLGALAFLVAAISAIARCPQSWCWDCLGFVVVGLSLIGVVMLATRVLKVRAELEAAAQPIIPPDLAHKAEQGR